MKIILTADVDTLGGAGDVVDVKDGYARNFLLPRQMALIANKSNMAVYETVRQQREAQQTREQREAETLAEALGKVSCNVAVTAGEGDRIFGSVTAQQIADLLKEQGFEIDRRTVQLDEPIRALGVYDVLIRLHSEVEATVKVWVVKE
ncbi:MAG: 50S ribosomal protein L9 [Candidatus Latescibacteria bacterium]|jgi:large subunit ribosomal protein L9|nr:50S ribosomal protein L9 [Candidatus Latescibacterota bacterium]